MIQEVNLINDYMKTYNIKLSDKILVGGDIRYVVIHKQPNMTFKLLENQIFQVCNVSDAIKNNVQNRVK